MAPIPRPAFSFAPFYKECAQYPELPKFRRFAEQWAKKLYDDAEELLEKENELNDAIAAFRRSQGRAVLTAIECPRSLAKGQKDLQRIWHEYEERLRSYSQDLYLSHQLCTLPKHAPVFSKRLREHRKLFHGGIFGPTAETNVAAYQNSFDADFVAWAGITDSDKLTNLYINNSSWIEDKILRRLRALMLCRRPARYGSQQTTFEVATVANAVDFITCIFVPFLLTTAMFALVLIHPLKVRIAMVGIFGLVFSLSAKVVCGKTSRGEIFAYSAAFFAVASVFVSATNGPAPMA